MDNTQEDTWGYQDQRHIRDPGAEVRLRAHRGMETRRVPAASRTGFHMTRAAPEAPSSKRPGMHWETRGVSTVCPVELSTTRPMPEAFALASSPTNWESTPPKIPPMWFSLETPPLAPRRIPPPPPPPGGPDDGNNGLVLPPPYPGSAGSTGSGAGKVSTGYGSQDGSGAYDFEYGQDIGPFQKESGDAAGNKKGVYGLKDPDGRTRTVTYEADDGGFRATVQSNEPGVDDTQDPEDIDVSKAPEPAGIALVYTGLPGSAPAGATLVTPPGSGAPAIPFAGDGGGAPLELGATGPIDTGFGQQDGSGTYNIAYGGDQAVGPWQKESGDSAGNKEGSYGFKDSDGRFRTVNYVAGNEGFRATVDTNEPGIDGAQNPADVVVNKSPEPAGIAPVVGSIGLPGGAGIVVGQPQVPATGDIPGVQGQVVLPAASLGPAVPGLPAVSPFPGTVGLGGIHGLPAGSASPAFSGPAHPGGIAFTVPSLGPASGYSFGHSGGPGGAFHRETGGPSGVKNGEYGFSGDGGTVRTVNYVADAGGFRASVQSNEPGVDISQSPTDVSFSAPGTATLLPAPSVPSGAHQHQAGHASAGWPPTQALPPLASGALGPWSSGSFGPGFSHNHGPGSFYYKTQVLGPHQSISEVHRY
ncbi:uncharacterized protein LOC144099192 isoform X1 [Amblyomma americanum]